VYLPVSPSISFPLALDPFGFVRGLGQSSTLPVSTMTEDSIATALTAAAKIPSPATPFLLAAAGIANLLATLGVGAGCGSTCIQATAVVNQAEPALLANLQQYEAGEISQDQALATYASVWQGIEVSCSAIPGQAGQDCISDRQAGACKWKATGTPPTPYSPADGACWNWDNAYRVPLTYPAANPAPASTDVTGAVTSALTSAESSLGISSSSSTWILLALAAAVALAVIL
jgi:hypothetical protein